MQPSAKERILAEFREKYKEAYKGILADNVIAEGNTWFEDFISSAIDQVLEEVLKQLPPEKDISLNEVGTVGDYHTHGYNEYHDKVRDIFRSHLSGEKINN